MTRAFVVVVLLCLLVLERGTAHAEVTTREMAVDRAIAHDVNPDVLLAVIACEAGPDLDSRATGDRGHSHGLAMLNDEARTGNLLGHFHSLGYESAYNRWEALDYLSRALSGEFADDPWGRIGPWRWSCWRKLRGWR